MGCGATAKYKHQAEWTDLTMDEDDDPLKTYDMASPSSATRKQVSLLDTAQDGLYSNLDSLWHALASRDMVLLRGSWLVELSKRGDILPGRLALPEEAVWPLDELKPMVENLEWEPQDSYQCLRKVQIVTISHRWLTLLHPDPQGQKLKILAEVVEQRLQYCGGPPHPQLHDLAVFIDWCCVMRSLHEPNPEKARNKAFYEVVLWLLHQHTVVWLLTALPSGWGGTMRFEQRGWTCFERALADMTADQSNVLFLSNFNTSCTSWEITARTCRARRKPPATQEDFALELRSKKFNYKEDCRVLEGLYNEAFKELFIPAVRLDFSDLCWGDAEARRLAAALPSCDRLRELNLSSNEIGSIGVVALAEALPRCQRLSVLRLDHNAIGLDETSVIVDMLRCSSSLEVLSLLGNRLDDVAKARLHEEWHVAGKALFTADGACALEL